MNIINIPIEVPDKQLDYILSACFEGGSNYWIGKPVVCKGNNYKGAEFASEALSKGATLLIVEDAGDEKPVTLELTKKKLLAGIERYAKGNKGIDFDTLDALQSDLILQYALFKEQKYS